jgi:protoheme IX farnesyltransferase
LINSNTENSDSIVVKVKQKLNDYYLLMKFTLSFTVVFSSVVCYLLAPGISFDFLSVLLLFVGGMLVTGSANAINQIVEKDTDALMQRTLKRPIASGRMSTIEGWIFAFCSALIGVLILGLWFNWLSAIISLFSLFLYAFVYTPLKKIHGIAVMVGAIPGALPCLIGWVAGTDSLSLGGWILFCIQFFWQFPHFWAIAWVSYNDYSKAGFKLLPDKGGPTRFAAIQSILYQVILVPLCVLPYFAQMTGKYSLIVLCVANVFMLWQCIRLYIEMDIKAARRVMFGSYGYLPIVLLALLADKLNG